MWLLIINIFRAEFTRMFHYLYLFLFLFIIFFFFLTKCTLFYLQFILGRIYMRPSRQRNCKIWLAITRGHTRRNLHARPARELCPVRFARDNVR
jgi:hypothetical protein